MGADNLLIHAEALIRLRTELQKQRGQTFDVGRFKALSGLTRKHAIPLLEYLDGARITRNQPGIRTVLSPEIYSRELAAAAIHSRINIEF